MKRPFESIIEACWESLERSRENTKLVFEHSDKFMVWIVSFSIGGLALSVSNLSQFDRTFSYPLIKSILILLTISIISGMVYRVAFYSYQIYYRQIEFFIEGAFSDKTLMETEVKDLAKETDFKVVIAMLKDDFDEDLSYMYDFYEQADSNKKEFLLNDLKSYYLKKIDWAKRDYEIGIQYVKDTFRKAFGISEKRIEKMFNENTSGKLKVAGGIAKIAFLISCLSFISVIIILCVAY